MRLKQVDQCHPDRGPRGRASSLPPTEDAGPELRSLRAEMAELRARERRYRSIVETSHEIVWEVDVAGRIVFVNAAACAVHGLKPEEMIGRAYSDFLAPGIRDAAIALFAEAVRVGADAVDLPTGIDRKEGAFVRPSINVRIFRGDDGRVGVSRDATPSGTTQDVAERRLAETALYDSRQALRAVLDSVPQRVFWKDRNSVYLGCNRAFAMDMGFDDPDEVIGKTDYDASWKASAELYRADDNAVVTSGQSKLNYEEPMLHPDGRQGWLRTSKVPLRGRDGNVTGIIGTYEDITERRLLQQQLMHAQRLESIGTLAAGMAHEINNPLTYLIGNAEISHEWLRTAIARLERLIGKAHDPAALARAIRGVAEIEGPLLDVLDGAERVRLLVLDIKGMARIEDGSRAPRELRSLVEAAVKMTANAVRHFASVRTRFAATPLVETGDGPLVQVLTNLLINAAQAIGEGRADANDITVTTYTDATGWACVEVRDTGPGIPADVLPRIFDPFFTTKPVGAGMGLGLSTSHNIVVGLGGRLTAESPPGGGAVFRVVLPPATRNAAPSPPECGSATVTRRGKVLVIDDEASVAVALGRILGQDHDVTVLTDGREAVASIAAGQVYHVIFCDLMMPNISGIDVHHAIAATSAAQAGRIVFMTGGAFTAASQAFLDRFGSRHVIKPFTAETIRSIAASSVK